MDLLDSLAEKYATKFLAQSPSHYGILSPSLRILLKDAMQEYYTVMENLEDSASDWKGHAFVEFWNLYNKKVGRASTQKKFMKLKTKEIFAILDTVKYFVAAHPDPQYRPHPVTYLNQRRWEDELPNYVQPSRTPDTVNTWEY